MKKEFTKAAKAELLAEFPEGVFITPGTFVVGTYILWADETMYDTETRMQWDNYDFEELFITLKDKIHNPDENLSAEQVHKEVLQEMNAILFTSTEEFYDMEMGHIAADKLMCRLLKKSGFIDLVNAYERIRKQYS